MKSDIHPAYYAEAQIRCSCGNVMVIGSTKESMRVELCHKCHPFYTGQQKLIDTAGRVDRFEAKRKAAEMIKEAKRAAKIKAEKPVEAKKPTKKKGKAVLKSTRG